MDFPERMEYHKERDVTFQEFPHCFTITSMDRFQRSKYTEEQAITFRVNSERYAI